MGIRFFCPNGHKLNVKSYQAGKRGICPHCGAKFTIPDESTLPSSNKAASPDTADADDEEILQEQAAEQAGASVEPHGEGPGGEQLDRQVVPPAAPPQKGDPFLDAPGASWYVSPPGGGQFGPASADMMKTWIAEGRVTADSLVWREGWDDWAEASTVLPHLVPPETAPYLPPPGSADTAAVANISIAQPGRTTGHAVRHPRGHVGRRRSSRDKTVKWVGILTALVVVLVILFLWMVNRS